MADTSADIVKSEGTEVNGNPAYFNYEDGLDATNQTDGGVAIGIKDSAIKTAKLVAAQAITATDAGLTTGAITAPTTYITVATVTSSAATKQVALPAITAAGIGQIIYINVGSNGYELITPASSGNTINLVDGDGTNQLDVAANTTVRCTQVSTTSWLAETIAATTIAVTAPDND